MPQPPRFGPPDSVGGPPAAPAEVREYAAQAIEYVNRALGVPLEYNSETLSVLDHYLRSVPRDNVAAAHLVAAAAGAYFGEVVRLRLGGSWELATGDPGEWQLVLPSGLRFSPAAMALATIYGPEEEAEEAEEHTDPNVGAALASSGWDATIQAPLQLRATVAEVLERMADVTFAEFYSLCGRLDTLEHLQETLAHMAAAHRSD
jgi:hypothetical protein